MDRTDPVDLALVATVGGFFALRTEPPREGAHIPLARVYGGDTAPLALRIDRVAARLRAPERRVAASVAQLGLAARLWSVALGSAVLTGAVPDLDARSLYWDPRLTSPDDLWLDAGPALPAGPEAVRETVQFGHLEPLAAAVRRDGPVAARLLWGNAGSALAGAVRELTGWAAKAGRPDAAALAATYGAALFDHPDLRTTGTWSEDGGFRRRSCCLYYRCPGGGLCGDCVFNQPPAHSSVQDVSG